MTMIFFGVYFITFLFRYFCFVTLSTIGFGDFVPKTNKDNAQVMMELGLSAAHADLVNMKGLSHEIS